MMPLLCLYADFVGILGGALVGVGMLDLVARRVLRADRAAVTLERPRRSASSRASVYGVLVALAGCLRGMQSGSSASAVGDAATSAVVTASC